MKYFIALLLTCTVKFTIAQTYIDTMILVRVPTKTLSILKRNNVSISWLTGQLLNNAWVSPRGVLVGYINVTDEEARSRKLERAKVTLSQNDLNSFQPRYRSIGGGHYDDHADQVSVSFPTTPPRRGSQEEAFLKNVLLDLEAIIKRQVDAASATAYLNTEGSKGLYERVLRRIAFIQYFNSNK
jgi:hypothetical protein